MTHESDPTETSPLLGERTDGKLPQRSVESVPNGSLNDQPYDESAQDAVRSRTTDEEQAKDVVGAAAQLKFIIPAVSIGVCMDGYPYRMRPYSS